MCLVASSWWLEDKTETPAGKAEGMRPRRSGSDEESEVLHGNQLRYNK